MHGLKLNSRHISLSNNTLTSFSCFWNNFFVYFCILISKFDALQVLLNQFLEGKIEGLYVLVSDGSTSEIARAWFPSGLPYGLPRMLDSGEIENMK